MRCLLPLLALFLSLPSLAAGNAKIRDFDAAKKLLPSLHAGEERTLYCG